MLKQAGDRGPYLPYRGSGSFSRKRLPLGPGQRRIQTEEKVKEVARNEHKGSTRASIGGTHNCCGRSTVERGRDLP